MLKGRHGVDVVDIGPLHKRFTKYVTMFLVVVVVVVVALLLFVAVFLYLGGVGCPKSSGTASCPLDPSSAQTYPGRNAIQATIAGCGLVKRNSAAMETEAASWAGAESGNSFQANAMRGVRADVREEKAGISRAVGSALRSLPSGAAAGDKD